VKLARAGALFGAGIQTVAAVSAFDNQAASAVGASGDASAGRQVCAVVVTTAHGST
jgi:hypothetical protein